MDGTIIICTSKPHGGEDELTDLNQAWPNRAKAKPSHNQPSPAEPGQTRPSSSRPSSSGPRSQPRFFDHRAGHTTAAISRTFCKGLTTFRTTGREGRKNRFKGLGHAAPRPNLRERIQTALAKAEPTEPTLAAPSRSRSNQSRNCPSQAGCQALWAQNALIKVTIGQSRTRPSDFLTHRGRDSFHHCCTLRINGRTSSHTHTLNVPP